MRATADTAAMDWAPSPSGTVFRKRVHLVGPPEAGQVTSVVRYAPGATFPAHDHPGGEEILVLDGVFSDEHGDWPAGTYLLNPEGFRHAPFSGPGCRLFVKLRQFPGTDREHHVIDTGAGAWAGTGDVGITVQRLYRQAGYGDAMHLERWAPGAQCAARTFPGGAELFVIDGAVVDDLGTHATGAWQRLPAGSHWAGTSPQGCTLYVKTGGLAMLQGVG